MNTADYLLEFVDDTSTAIITKNAQYSYGDLKAVIAHFLYKLHVLQIKPFDRIGILGENSLLWIAAYLAVLKVGAIAVPLPTVVTPEDLQQKAGVVNCKAVFLERRSYRKFANTLNNCHILIFDETLREAKSDGYNPDIGDFDIDQDAALMLTSGTTAFPRAVRITHRNIQSNTNSIVEYLGLDRSNRILVVLPFYYCFGTSLLHTHLRVGGSLVLCNSFAYPETALDMLETTGCTEFAGVPSTYQILLRNSTFLQRRFTTLRTVQQAGGKLPEVFIKELMEALPAANIYIMYGQTEATARLSYLPPNLLKTKLGSVGQGIPGVGLEVINSTGLKVKPGEIGEIIASGDNISPGYLNDPDASAEKFLNGALHTGDLATVDEDGFIYIVDRKSDFIKSFGHRVSSQEVEAIILQINDVVNAAAIGEPDDIQGEAIIVYITLRKGARLTEKDVKSHCRQRMAPHMVPKHVVILDHLPMNAHGKIIKSALRESLHMEPN
jgi:long-chain acyl-CoA synthetase